MLVDNISGMLEKFGTVEHFEASMRNDYLNGEGAVFKKQAIKADVARHLMEPYAGNVLCYDHVWNRVSFSAQSKKIQSDIDWSFAKGQHFMSAVKGTTAFYDRKKCPPAQPDMNLGSRWFRNLPATPAVNLLILFSMDFIMFEEIYASLICCEPDQLTGRPFIHQGSVGRKMHLGLGGLAMERSYFENQMLMFQYLGVSSLNIFTSHIFQFRGSGDLCTASNANSSTIRGNSYYLGTIQIDTKSLYLRSAEMIECLTLSSIDAKGRRKPTPRRRVVRLENKSI